jgi:hypothetical protein
MIRLTVVKVPSVVGVPTGEQQPIFVRIEYLSVL